MKRSKFHWESLREPCSIEQAEQMLGRSITDRTLEVRVAPELRAVAMSA